MGICILLITTGKEAESYITDLKNLFESVTVVEGSTKDELITVDDIIEVTADCFGQSIHDVLGDGRRKVLTNARQVIMYLMFQELGMSYSAIGRKMGRDHSTVMHGISRIENVLDSLRDGKFMVNEICHVKGKLRARISSRKHG